MNLRSVTKGTDRILILHVDLFLLIRLIITIEPLFS